MDGGYFSVAYAPYRQKKSERQTSAVLLLTRTIDKVHHAVGRGSNPSINLIIIFPLETSG